MNFNLDSYFNVLVGSLANNGMTEIGDGDGNDDYVQLTFDYRFKDVSASFVCNVYISDDDVKDMPMSFDLYVSWFDYENPDLEYDSFSSDHIDEYMSEDNELTGSAKTDAGQIAGEVMKIIGWIREDGQDYVNGMSELDTRYAGHRSGSVHGLRRRSFTSWAEMNPEDYDSFGDGVTEA